MSSRLDLVLRKCPGHEEGIRLLASRDPSGNLKYLDWGAKILVSKQALALEVADVLELFHKFQGRYFGKRREQRVRPDIYTYHPQDLAALRDNLLKIKRTQDRKRRTRERLYRIEGEIETDVVYDSPDLIVRHIKNKQASVHYGLGTKWCIAMLREGYFEDYETQNATFFFFERKKPLKDDLDKVAIMVPRNVPHNDATVEAFTTLDQRVDMFSLAKTFGVRVFDIFKEVYERSERYPGSAMFRICSGNATREELELAFARVAKGTPETVRMTLRAICCNDATPQSVLEEIVHRASELYVSATKTEAGRVSARRRDLNASELVRDVMAATVIHPNTSDDLRAEVTKDLRRRRVKIDTIFREMRQGQIEVAYDWVGRKARMSRGKYLRLRREPTVAQLLTNAQRWERRAIRERKRAETLQRKLAKKAAKRKEQRCDTET